jgi:predicted MPP superfamily phosphohydrolase
VTWLVAVAVVAGLAMAVVGYAWLEAGWLRRRLLEVPVAGLPEELDGLRVAHLSDFHLGAPLSRGRHATRKAVAWVAAREPDLVCVTGDLVSHPRGEPALRALLTTLGRPYVVLGNHDIAVSRDPFSRAAELDDLGEAVLLRDESAVAESAGRPGARVQVVGVDPASYRARTADPSRLADPGAGLRILLCHYPGIGRRLPAGSFDLILAGHLHAGQITIPFPGRPLALAHPRAPEVAGLYRVAGAQLHVSPGTGTTFLPLRLFARPEVTELVLRRT